MMRQLDHGPWLVDNQRGNWLGYARARGATSDRELCTDPAAVGDFDRTARDTKPLLAGQAHCNRQPTLGMGVAGASMDLVGGRPPWRRD